MSRGVVPMPGALKIRLRGRQMILMFYTNARGGIRAVCEGYIRDGITERWNIHPVITHDEGSVTRRVVIFAGALLSFLKHLVTGRVEAVHCHVATRGSMWRKVIVCKLAAAAGIPSILHLHGAETADFFDKQPRWRQRLIVSVLERCEFVVSLSDGWSRFVTRVAPRANVRAIPNYVTLPPVPVRAPHSGVRALFLGEVGWRKGAYDLLKAIQIAVREVPDLVVRIGGNGEVDKAREMARELGIDAHVEFLGWVSGDAKTQALTDADFYVLPSYHEGLPVSIVEAMSVELPVISTTAGAIPEMITEGVEGYIVVPGDVDALARALVAMSKDPERRRRMGAAARLRAERTYSREVVIPMIDDLYAACLGTRRGGPGAAQARNGVNNA